MMRPMEKAKVIKYVIWFLAFALSVFMLLVIPNSYSQSIWVTFVFDTIAFVSQLVLWLSIFNRPIGEKGVFNRYPLMIISSLYLVIEFIFCVIVAIAGPTISFKISLTMNFIILVIAWIILLMLIMAKNHVERTDSRQTDHHVEV